MRHQPLHKLRVRNLSLGSSGKDRPRSFHALHESLVDLSISNLSVTVVQSAQRQRKDTTDTRHESVDDRPGRIDCCNGRRLGDEIGNRHLHQIRHEYRHNIRHNGCDYVCCHGLARSEAA